MLSFLDSRSDRGCLAGGIIALWKSVVITVKVEIGGAAAQIVLREVADKRRLYLVAITVF
jgi:hypothetical protein